MKNLILLLGCLIPGTLIYAQTNTIAHKGDSLMMLPVRKCGDSSAPYWIDGVRVSNKNRIVGVVDYIIIPPVRMEGTTTIQQEQLINLPVRNVNAIAGIVAGVDSRAGQPPNIRGAREDGTAYYIDGIRIRGLDLP